MRKQANFFQIFEFVFKILNFIFVKKNVNRIVRYRFRDLRIKFNQIFSKFFSKFILLINQMIDISKQIKIKKLREKLTSQLQKIIINNEKFHTIETFKTLMKQVDLKLNSIVYDKQNKQNNKRKTRVNKIFFKNNINQKIFNVSIINNRRTFFKN